MMIGAMFYRESLVSDIPVTIGLINFTTQEIFVSLASVTITNPINMLIELGLCHESEKKYWLSIILEKLFTF